MTTKREAKHWPPHVGCSSWWHRGHGIKTTGETASELQRCITKQQKTRENDSNTGKVRKVEKLRNWLLSQDPDCAKCYDCTRNFGPQTVVDCAAEGTLSLRFSWTLNERPKGMQIPNLWKAGGMWILYTASSHFTGMIEKLSSQLQCSWQAQLRFRRRWWIEVLWGLGCFEAGHVKNEHTIDSNCWSAKKSPLSHFSLITGKVAQENWETKRNAFKFPEHVEFKHHN